MEFNNKNESPIKTSFYIKGLVAIAVVEAIVFWTGYFIVQQLAKPSPQERTIEAVFDSIESQVIEDLTPPHSTENRHDNYPNNR
jgi:hypothetical protein